MSRNILTIVADIAALPTVDGEDVARLELLITEYFASDEAANHVEVWFRLFEKFPDEDGYETFWAILHGIEAQPHYETELIKSLERRPADFTLLMVNRLINNGTRSVNGIDLLSLLEQSVDHALVTAQGKRSALNFSDYQRRKRD